MVRFIDAAAIVSPAPQQAECFLDEFINAVSYGVLGILSNDCLPEALSVTNSISYIADIVSTVIISTIFLGSLCLWRYYYFTTMKQ